MNTDQPILKLLVLLFFIISLTPACGKKSDSGKITVDEEKTEAKIKNLLFDCQIKISEINNTLQYETDIVKLNDSLSAFSGSIKVVVRNRGVLLDNNKVITSFNIHEIKDEQIIYNTYIGLFDGDAKKLLSFVLIGPYLSVISVLKNKSDNSLIDVDALVREQGKPAKKIQKFQIKVENNTITTLQ